jgi:MFS transporter, DHA2 family, multidrug resistance protein
MIFVSITSASYNGIPPDKTGQVSALINAARNTGGSIGISLISNVLWPREQFYQTRLVDQALQSSVQYQDTLPPDDELFRRAGQSANRGATADHCLGRAAGAPAGVIPRLHGRLLGADAGRAGGSTGRAEPAQGQAGRRRADGPLSAIQR